MPGSECGVKSCEDPEQNDEDGDEERETVAEESNPSQLVTPAGSHKGCGSSV